MLNRFLDPILMRVLTEEASKIANKARQNASWSSTIPRAIKVGTATTDGNGRYQIDIIVDTSPNGAPSAAAFEFGSGIHKKENPELYPIAAKNTDNLVFWWEKRSKWFVGPKLPFGHPGVAPRPYLMPAVNEMKPSIIARLISVIKHGFLDSIKTEFKNVQTK